ncbi:MAG: insulinase family protein [Proteobacteria bacterium]|nr:insulinase family protein [Pseudomonadota bacterium]MBU1737633.1 insulinase family protein [Pseudomonadota bacterium]
MYQKTVLDNSVRIVTEKLPSQTVSIGIWIDTGSRDEDEFNNGSAHFVEHMLFKGTRCRTAQQIARELDMLGGMSNAFTSTEQTSLYATVLDSHLEKAVDLLGDLFLNSVFSDEEVESERQVILQEIAMVEDTPDDRVHEIFASLIWNGHPLGNTVLGSHEVVSGLNREILLEYVRKQYLPERIIIVAAGSVDHQRFVDLWQQKLSSLAGSPSLLHRVTPAVEPLLLKVVHKPLEQVHLVLGTKGLPITSEDRYKLMLLNIILGGNMSSRLYQEIREKRGLAYSVYSYLVSYSDSGYLGIYLGVDPNTLLQVVDLVKTELDLFVSGPVTEEELSRAVDYTKGGMYLSAENMEARMTRLARNELFFHRSIAMEEVAERLEGVTPMHIMEMAKSLLSGSPLSLSVIGPVDEKIVLGLKI